MNVICSTHNGKYTTYYEGVAGVDNYRESITFHVCILIQVGFIILLIMNIKI